jgi:hypothetical protein
MKVALIVSLLLMAGCTAEGNSYSLGAGQTTRFVSLAACETEAKSKQADGSPRYAGYECRELLLDRWAREIVRYENGAPADSNN